jgi:geranylgeranyl diphosphate synthase type I
LAIVSCLACGGKIKDVIHPAAGLEILHNWSLIIDDMIDHSDKRRGKPTTWKTFGPSFAQCIGAQYGASLLTASVSSPRSHIIAKLFAKALKKVMNGEIEDILFEQGRREDPYFKTHRVQHVTLNDYFSMIGKKTASLLEASCEVGGIASYAPKKNMEALKHYGWHLGMAFQVTDDILDIYGTGELGKPVGQDVRERKLGNILVLFAKVKLKKTEVAKVIQAIKNTNARDLAFAVAGLHIKRAKSELLKLKPSPARNALGEIADYTLTRKT